MSIRYLLLLIALLAANGWGQSHDPLIVRVPAPQEQTLDASYNYFTGLLQLALAKGAGSEWHLSTVSSNNMSQARMLRQIQLENKIDIYWAGTSIKREKALHAIRVPLLKGLLGFRVAIMHKSVEGHYQSINNAKAFYRLKPCQGADWPDSDILEHSGFRVIRNPSLKGMYEQVSIMRCHFFPRGIHEVEAEYSAVIQRYPNLKLNKSLIIHYPFPMYFFVNKHNDALIDVVRRGLELAIDDGSFEYYMRTSDVTKHLFPLDSWIHARYLELKNPFLPADTDTHNPRYWIQYDASEDELIR
ncbi:hypothetical protein [Teredinibacter sp. KSP-S5-2]|uniref:hypothetical protein n=1 Tax=Teredinibacter sp. KSP-S5-2 TaxID=3034506 RepID=UPI0029350105|nr:hypothetical protein [Teredinibacter sp. KSP-S5-2]WNO09681.1 hypothetical protein P5V12_00615 [Teredinibacter sp. KSP-S5-2]